MGDAGAGRKEDLRGLPAPGGPGEGEGDGKGGDGGGQRQWAPAAQQPAVAALETARRRKQANRLEVQRPVRIKPGVGEPTVGLLCHERHLPLIRVGR